MDGTEIATRIKIGITVHATSRPVWCVVLDGTGFFLALNVYAMTAVTAITVQNTLGVSDVHAIPSDVVGAQMRACLEDIGADAIKLGMLHPAEWIETVAAVLADFPEIPVIADPVRVDKGGAKLLQSDASGG